MSDIQISVWDVSGVFYTYTPVLKDVVKPDDLGTLVDTLLETRYFTMQLHDGSVIGFRTEHIVKMHIEIVNQDIQ